MEKHNRIKRELSFKGSIVDFYSDTILMDNNKEVIFDYINHHGASAILAVDSDGKILMVRQYRNAIDSFTLEIPAGSKEPEEDSLSCAIRECEEETGYIPHDVKHLFDLHTTVAFCNELISVYYTSKLTASQQNLDEDEFIDIERHSLDDLVSMIFAGKITDAKTIAALLAYKAKMNI